jgi:hypothetical protein
MPLILVLLAATLGLSACFPIAAHPTRIEPGPEVTMGFSGEVTLDSSAQSGRHLGRMPNFNIGFAAGFRDPDGRDGIASRLAIAVGLAGLAADTYLELPREWFSTVDAGFGVTWQTGPASVVLPYIQAGHQFGDGAVLFRNLGRALARGDSLGRVQRWVITVGGSILPVGQRAPGRVSLLTFVSFLPGAKREEATCLFSCAGAAYYRSVLMIVGFTASRAARRPDGFSRDARQ